MMIKVQEISSILPKKILGFYNPCRRSNVIQVDQNVTKGKLVK